MSSSNILSLSPSTKTPPARFSSPAPSSSDALTLFSSPSSSSTSSSSSSSSLFQPISTPPLSSSLSLVSSSSSSASSANAILVRERNFTSAKALVVAFNAEYNSKNNDEEYLKYLKMIALCTVGLLKEFKDQQGINTFDHIKEFSHLVLAEDSEIYTTIVNTLAHEAQNKNLIVNSNILKALTEVIWQNESQTLSHSQLEFVLLNIIKPNMDLKLPLLSLFCKLLDTMVRAEVSDFSKEILKQLQDEVLESLLKQAEVLQDTNFEKEQIKFMIFYAYQASLRIGSNESKAQMFKRKLFSFLLGIKELSSAAGNLTEVVSSLGLKALTSVPEAIDNIIKSKEHFEKAFHTRRKKENWYEQLNELQGAIFAKAFEKEAYDDEDLEKFKINLSALIKQKNDLHLYVKFGIIDVLKEVILNHSDEGIKNYCMGILKIYSEDNDILKIKVLNTFAELSKNSKIIQQKVLSAIVKLNLEQEYDKIEKEWKKFHTIPIGNAINLIGRAKIAADETLKNAKNKGLVFNVLLIKAKALASGSKADFSNISAFETNIGADATKEQLEWAAKDMDNDLDKVFAAASEINVVNIGEAVAGPNSTLTVRDVTLKRVNIGTSRPDSTKNHSSDRKEEKENSAKK